MGDWIKQFKNRVNFAQVAAAIGMKEHGRRWKPCPACNRDRTDGDARPCVTVGADGGWHCWACKEKGDAVTLLCFSVARSGSPSSEGWEEVRKAAVKHGWIKDEGGPTSGRIRHVSTDLSRRTAQPKAIAGPPVSPAETPAEQAVNTRGFFRWTDDLPERCAQVYAATNDIPSFWPQRHRQIGNEIFKYLTEYRKISDLVLQDARIGIYVDESGALILSDGRPWITIPLPDKAGRFVNIHFRRVPIAGTCADCDALGPWKECDPCRKGKRYRLCPGRPTPLYGADRLTPGKGEVARVIEGEFDVLALRTYGLGRNTVSGTSGASNFAEDWLDSLEPFDSIYLCYDDDEAGKKGASDLAAKLGAYKCSKVTFPKKDVGDCLIAGVPQETIERAFKVAESYLDVKLRRAGEFRERVKERLQNTEQRRGVSTTSEVMDSAIGGWSNGLVVVTGETGNGKAQPVDEPVLTPTGWVRIGDIRVGDDVISVDGKPARVAGVFPQGVRETCEVEFSDGVKVRCDWDHLWAVTRSGSTARKPYGDGAGWVVRKTSEITETLNSNDWYVPLMAGREPWKRRIEAIRPAGQAECVCIAVDHPSHLYVTTGYTVTHNTTWTTWQLWALAKSGQCVAFTSFEQQPEETVIQLLHMELGGMPDDFKEADWDAALDRLSELPILIVDHYGHLPYVKLEEALKYAVRRCGVRYILIDHLGFLVDPEAEDERRAIQSVVRSMVLVRKDMDVTIFLIVHPRNDPDASKKFGRVTMQHLKGASAIRQDADMVLIVTRELPNTEKGRLLGKGRRRPWPQTRIYIDKKRGRYGNVSGAGEVVLAFDPKALVFADTWEQTPMGRTGVLVDTTPSEIPDEGEDAPSSPNRAGGAKKGTKGRQTKTGGSAFDDSY